MTTYRSIPRSLGLRTRYDSSHITRNVPYHVFRHVYQTSERRLYLVRSSSVSRISHVCYLVCFMYLCTSNFSLFSFSRRRSASPRKKSFLTHHLGFLSWFKTLWGLAVEVEARIDVQQQTTTPNQNESSLRPASLSAGKKAHQSDLSPLVPWNESWIQLLASWNHLVLSVGELYEHRYVRSTVSCTSYVRLIDDKFTIWNTIIIRLQYAPIYVFGTTTQTRYIYVHDTAQHTCEIP